MQDVFTTEISTHGAIKQIANLTNTPLGPFVVLFESGHYYGVGHAGSGLFGTGISANQSSPYLMRTDVDSILRSGTPNSIFLSYAGHVWIKLKNGKTLATGLTNTFGSGTGVNSTSATAQGGTFLEVRVPSGVELKLLGQSFNAAGGNPAGPAFSGVAIDTNNNWWGWGLNNYGLFFDNSPTNGGKTFYFPTPVKVTPKTLL